MKPFFYWSATAVAMSGFLNAGLACVFAVRALPLSGVAAIAAVAHGVTFGGFSLVALLYGATRKEQLSELGSAFSVIMTIMSSVFVAIAAWPDPLRSLAAPGATLFPACAASMLLTIGIASAVLTFSAERTSAIARLVVVSLIVSAAVSASAVVTLTVSVRGGIALSTAATIAVLLIAHHALAPPRPCIGGLPERA